MSEIKIGEYIRYSDGRIFKVIEEEVDYYNYLLKTRINECGITKHSLNIIDLIEERRLCERKINSLCIGKSKKRRNYVSLWQWETY